MALAISSPHVNKDILWNVTDYLGPHDLLSLLRAVPSLVQFISSRHINRKPEDKTSILHLLAETDEIDLLDAILSKSGVNINPLNKCNIRPLSYALRSEEFETMKVFLKHDKVDVNSWCHLLQGDTPLVYAIRTEQQGVLDLLLGRVNIIIADDKSESGTPFSCAIEKGNLALIKQLLSRACMNKGHLNDALLHAAQCGSMEMVKFLLSQPEMNADHKIDNIMRVLSRVAERGHVEVAKLLLSRPEFNGTRDYVDEMGRTPLSYAAMGGNLEVVDLLLSRTEFDADHRDREGKTPLILAAQRKRTKVASFLLSLPHVDVKCQDEYGRTPLSYAAERGLTEMVNTLLLVPRINADSPDRYGRTPLSYAAQNERTEVVELLLSRPEVNVNYADESGATPLSIAAMDGHIEVMKLLLSRPEVNANHADECGATPLSIAAMCRQIEAMKLLLSRHEVMADHQDHDGYTPLMYVASSGRKDMVVELLAKHHVKADMGNKKCRTPLSLAAENGHEAVVKLLLEEHSAEANSTDCCGRCPLSYAAQRGHEAVAKLLLENSADANSTDSCCRRCPLSYAAQEGHAAVVRLLLSQPGIQAHGADKWGFRPLHYAFACRHHRDGHAVRQLLLEHAHGAEEVMAQLLLAVVGQGLQGTLPDEIDRQCTIPLAEMILRSHPKVLNSAAVRPLSKVIDSYHEDLAIVLVDCGGNPKTRVDWDDALEAAIRKNHERLVQKLLHHKVPADYANTKPLRLAAGLGRARIFTLLLDHYDKLAHTWALSCAARGAQPKILRMLLDQKVPAPIFDIESATPIVGDVALQAFREVCKCANEQNTTETRIPAQRIHKLVVSAMLGLQNDELRGMNTESSFYLALRYQVSIAQMVLDGVYANALRHGNNFTSPSSSLLPTGHNCMQELLSLRHNQRVELRRDNLKPVPCPQDCERLHRLWQVVWYLLNTPYLELHVGSTSLVHAIGGPEMNWTWLLSPDFQEIEDENFGYPTNPFDGPWGWPCGLRNLANDPVSRAIFLPEQ